MRITIVSPFDPTVPATADGTGGAQAHVGGVERALAALAQGLADRGHGVTLVCSGRGAQPSPAAWPEGRPTSGGQVVVVRQRRLGTILRAPAVRLARMVPPDTDILHVPATYPFTTGSVLRSAARRGIPAVLDFHFEPHPGTRLARVAAAGYRRVGPPSYRLAAAVLVRSAPYARACRTLAAVPAARWRTVPNGIDAARFHGGVPARVLAGCPDGYLLFVGRLVPYKGLDVLLRALALRPSLPLVVVGDGPLRTPLEAQAKRLGVPATFLGAVPDDALPGLYAGARLTVLPSITSQEAFGIVLLESMACGTPVVASDLPGVADVARLGGLVSPPGQPAALAEAIAHGLRGPPALARAALADRIRSEFSWPAIAAQVEAVYAEVLQDAPGRTGHPGA